MIKMRNETDAAEGAMEMFKEPFPQIAYLAVKERVEAGVTGAELAEAYADVTRKCGALWHETDDPELWRERGKISEGCAMWEELEEELFDRIVEILREENETHGTEHVLSGIGRHFIVKPFMERNGFRDGAGWWTEDKPQNEL